MRIWTQFAIAGLVAGGLAVAGPASAADEPDVYEDEQAKPDEGFDQEELTEEDLRAFLEAAEAIEGIRADYVERILDADKADRGGLRSDANEAMLEAIEEAGIDPQTYRNIGYLLGEGDGDLSERVDEAERERQHDS